MVFNPVDLFRISREMASNTRYPEEARYRTAINRAYYSAFLLSYQMLLSQGERFENENSVHRDVRERLQNVDGVIASRLERLHDRYRVPSDYYIDDVITVEMVRQAERLTKSIIDTLQEKYFSA